MEPLLQDEQNLFDSIRGYLFTHQYPPSVRELIDLSDCRSSDRVQRLLKQLREKGYLDWRDKQSRTYQLLVGNMPLCGVIQAGYVEQQPSDLSTYIDVSGAQYKIQDYALKVQGDSMSDAHICDGDFVIIRPVKEIESLKPGTITAVWVEGEGTTLKYLYQKDGWVTLKAANSKYKSQKFEPNHVQPQGVLVGLHRIYND
jgi:repressor LexA